MDNWSRQPTRHLGNSSTLGRPHKTSKFNKQPASLKSGHEYSEHSPDLLGGSSSSEASSSGCSSIECSSSLESPSNKKLPKCCPKGRPNHELEVNELMYLQPPGGGHQCGSLMRDLSNIRPTATMSEFSAFTLRKSLKHRLRASNDGLSRTPKVELSTLNGQQSDCCCCSGQCHVKRPQVRRSMGARHRVPPDSAKAPSSESSKTARTATQLSSPSLVAKSRVHRQHMRRPVPVPPPVVPLYKEIALLEPAGVVDENLLETHLACETPRDSLPPPQNELRPSDSTGSKLNIVTGIKDTDKQLAEPLNKSSIYGDNWRNLSQLSVVSETDRSEGGLSKVCPLTSGSHLTSRSSVEVSKVATVTKKKGRFFDKLRQSFMSNFQNCQSSEPSALDGSHSNAQPIYDTPERDDRERDEPAKSVLRKSVPLGARPSVPPPPPPPPLPPASSAKVNMGQMRTAPAVHSDCVEASSSSIPEATLNKFQLDISFKKEASQKGQVELETDPNDCLAAKAVIRDEEQQCQCKRRKAVKWAEDTTHTNSANLDHQKDSAPGEESSRSDHQQPTKRFTWTRSALPRILPKSGNKTTLILASVDTDRQQRELAARKGILVSKTLNLDLNSKQNYKQRQNKDDSANNKMGSNHSVPALGHSAKTVSSATENIPTKLDNHSDSSNAIKPSFALTNKLLAGEGKQTTPINRLHSGPSKTGNHKPLNKVGYSGAELTRQAHNKASSTTAQRLEVSYADSIEKRRKSINNGDVFIYPAVYKDLNECQKCLRDQRICNCNCSPKLDSLTSNDTIKSGELAQIRSSSAVVPLTDKLSPQQGVISKSESGSKSLSGQQQKPDMQQHLKTVYKISIATASIDQKSNLLRLSSPKIIVPKSQPLSPSMPLALMGTDSNCLQRKSTIYDSPESVPCHDLAVAKSDEQLPCSDPFAMKLPARRVTSASLDNESRPLEGASGAERTSTQRITKAVNPDERPVGSEQHDFITRNNLLLITPQKECQYPIDSNPKSQANKIEAKVTAISIGSQIQAHDGINLKGLLSPLLSTTEPNATIALVDANNNTVEPCDNKTIKAHWNVNEVVEKEETVNDGKLTCNLSVGDSIKITNTSIMIGGKNQHNLSSPLDLVDETDRTSIVPIQTISNRRRNLATKLSRQAIDEDDDFDCEKTAYLNQRIVLPSATDSSLDLVNQDSSSDVLEYSPILTSVRDFIKNVNTELQVSTKSSQQQSIDEFSGGESSLEVNGQGIVVSSLMDQSARNESTSEMTDDILKTTSFTQVNLTTTPMKVMHTNEPESPKKSIFDGASKDEILEYLEDARERVPEILMAADDVMLISENELIVVNQLEPNSPATPISIVEATDVLDSRTSSVLSENDSQSDSNHIRQLKQIFQNSDRSCSQFSSNNTTDEDTGIGSDPNSGLNSKLDFNSSMEAVSPTDKITFDVRKICNNLKSLSTITGTTLDSLTDQVVSGSLEAGLAVESNETHQTRADRSLERTSSEFYQQTDTVEHIRQSVKMSASSISNTSNTSVSEASSSGMINYTSSPKYSNRRNSSSDGSSLIDKNCALQMLLMQQRYSNRNSLSSSSSSPPSSTSPSSSNSSNQTSGNCSATSNFYASSPLSSSSPLLALNSVATGTTDFNKVTPISNVAIIKLNQSTQNEQLLDSLNKDAHSNTSSEIVDYCLSRLEGDYPNSESDKSTLPVNLELTSFLDSSKILKGISKDVSQVNYCLTKFDAEPCGKLGVIEEVGKDLVVENVAKTNSSLTKLIPTTTAPTFSSSSNLMSMTLHGHYTTISRLNNYFLNRHPLMNNSQDTTIEFQCLDCDQFIDVDQTKLLQRTNELRLLRESELSADSKVQKKEKPLTTDQLDRAYIAAMNGLPLCKSCEKKRIERKEIISEFVETELKYGRDLKIIHDEFYRPMQIAGLLSKEQINGVFLNLEELIMAHCRFADRLETSINEANSMGDNDYNTVNIGRLFVESAEMLHTFETYCIRQGSSAFLLARLAKEKELLRIFLRVSQIENTLLRRMNLAAFLMVPVQRVTKYPLLLNRLYKVTAYHHKDREALRDAQLKVELHLEHINQQTKGVGATNKIWRRISSLSAPISSRRGLINAEDIGYIKLRKTAMDMLKWDRDETQFIHSGKLNFVPLSEFLTKQKMKPMRYMAAHALLVVLGKPNWKYRPDLVKSNLDSKLMTPTPGGNGIKETALLLFREKNGRFLPCREPLFLSNCVLSNDCSQFNSECPLNQTNHHPSKTSSVNQNSNNLRRQLTGGQTDNKEYSSNESRSGSFGNETSMHENASETGCIKALKMADINNEHKISPNDKMVSISSTKSFSEDQGLVSAPVAPTSRSHSLASALPKTTITATTLATARVPTTSSNMTILNQFMTKVNKRQATNGTKVVLSDQSKSSTVTNSLSSITNVDTNNCSTQGQADSILANSRHSTATVNINANMVTHSEIHQQYNHHYFHNHHQPYGDYEESFEIHERLSKESLLLRADTLLKTRYWLQMLRYHAKDLGQWRSRRNGLANIMMVRQE